MPAPTTFAAFTQALQALDVAGVVKRLDFIPASISDLPCQWVQMPESTEALMTFEGTGGWPELRAQVIIAVEAAAQGQPLSKWNATIAMIDAAAAALRAVAAGTLAKSKPLFRLRMVTVTVAGSDYYAVEATVTAHG